jgi:DNA-binding response OmpR family regulator
MSGHTDDATVQHGVTSEGVELLHKPFSLDELAARLDAALAAPPG